MNDMIKKIIETNQADLIKRKAKNPVSELEKKITQLPKTLGFSTAIEQAFSSKGIGIIAEIKLASPSAGNLAESDQVLEIAGEYKDGSADAISVISEKYFFKGDVKFISLVKEKTGLPVLQKDFIVDPYQIYEARIYGADALLLIAKIISPDQLRQYVEVCIEIGLEPVVEINDELDLENALQTKTKIIAVNARDLDTFKVDVERACELLGKIPDRFLKLGFSGVNSKEEVEKYKQSLRDKSLKQSLRDKSLKQSLQAQSLKQSLPSKDGKNAGAKGVLVGTNLIKAQNKKEFLKGLR